jgi:hypothetical protein
MENQTRQCLTFVWFGLKKSTNEQKMTSGNKGVKKIRFIKLTKKLITQKILQLFKIGSERKTKNPKQNQSC